jgi:hypothetical protein
MTNLSPAAQQVFWAFNSKFNWIEDGVPGPQFNAIAAALRTAADQLSFQLPFEDSRCIAVLDLLAIADEFENNT